ncbi:ATP-dependent Clp protease proteolytic subunit [Isoptericola halotolerans]|uniref:ATP-dependent Clp protease proteolytic subunit n=1 Tax=Isoptericola halotolerans TaxID=300560 RepID=A0ABX2A3M3_9MICO|nr:ATP-dependent Clp protease proteolytic subunit [Isoptericola halotolerans]NOV97465.1 ATP-dependent Clp protease protease subunit [Isoptericola halotolerans]
MEPTLRSETPPPTTPFDDQLATRLLHQRIVVIGTEVDDAVANRVCAQLLLLSAEDPASDVALYVNSPGGSVSAGLAVYDTMRLLPNDVVTVGFGFAASMGQFLLTAGTAGKRYALPHTRVMMHQPSAGIGGTAVDIAIQAENLEHTKRLMHELTAQHSGRTVEQVTADADRDRWFTAAEALEYGLVDRIVESVDDVRPAAAGRKAGL